MITLREVKSQNSWMHNSTRLMPPGRRHVAHIHPEDAQRFGVADGGSIKVSSRGGSIELGVICTEDLTPGTIAVPHGWDTRADGTAPTPPAE